MWPFSKPLPFKDYLTKHVSYLTSRRSTTKILSSDFSAEHGTVKIYDSGIFYLFDIVSLPKQRYHFTLAYSYRDSKEDYSVCFDSRKRDQDGLKLSWAFSEMFCCIDIFHDVCKQKCYAEMIGDVRDDFFHLLGGIIHDDRRVSFNGNSVVNQYQFKFMDIDFVLFLSYFSPQEKITVQLSIGTFESQESIIYIVEIQKLYGQPITAEEINLVVSDLVTLVLENIDSYQEKKAIRDNAVTDNQNLSEILERWLNEQDITGVDLFLNEKKTFLSFTVTGEISMENVELFKELCLLKQKLEKS